MQQYRKYEVEWIKLNELAREYFDITQKLLPNNGRIYYESGRDPDTEEIVKIEIDSRSQRQKDLAADIIEGAYPYIRKIVQKLMYGEGQDVKGKNGKTNRFYLCSLQDFSTLDDLVSLSAIIIMKSLHNYNPRYSVSTFIHQNVVFGLNRYSSPGLIRIPEHMKQKARKAVKNGSGSTMKHKIHDELKTTEATMGSISHSLTGRYVSIDQLIGQQSFMNPRYGVPRRRSYAEVFLPDKSFAGDTERQVEESLMKDAVERQLKTLTEREERVLKLRYGIGEAKRVSPKYNIWYMSLEEVGNIFNVSNSRVMQIQNKAERKLRHPKRTIELKPYLKDLE
ncbi:MAG: sigma-70 family RNA polymerase sigma factor [Candidatus Pacearchaeota archaeon]